MRLSAFSILPFVTGGNHDRQGWARVSGIRGRRVTTLPGPMPDPRDCRKNQFAKVPRPSKRHGTNPSSVSGRLEARQTGQLFRSI
jgi:hypothetical protein